MVGILHFDLPNALLGRIDEHHFDVVEGVSGPGLNAAAVAEHVPEVGGSVGRGDLEVEIVDQLGARKPRAALVRPCQDDLERAA